MAYTLMQLCQRDN